MLFDYRRQIPFLLMARDQAPSMEHHWRQINGCLPFIQQMAALAWHLAGSRLRYGSILRSWECSIPIT